MLGYLHGYHAGNTADVLKHSVLIFCLAYLKAKEKPLLCVDTHAGAGIYNLAGIEPKLGEALNREWGNGIGRLINSAKDSAKIPPMIEAYLRFQSDYLKTRRYAGSPEIMKGFLQKGDRLVCFELHPREFEVLETTADPGAGKPVIEARREDGPSGLKALLPPVSRRGLILIDPSWEEKDEYESIPRSVREGLRRFPEGVFIIWYPLLTLSKGRNSSSLPDRLFGLSDAKRCRVSFLTGNAGKGPGAGNVMDVESTHSPRGMYGSGLVIYNPPWTLKAALEEALPFLAHTMGGEEGGWHIDWTE